MLCINSTSFIIIISHPNIRDDVRSYDSIGAETRDLQAPMLKEY